MYKLSFCTVAMNRLHHLKKTLPKNIADNAGYDNVEFVILDYNSTDGLKEWIKENYRDLIYSGKLVYYRTNEPEYFNRSHSRNMVFKISTGDIICNIDADNYAGERFAEYVNAEFQKDGNIFLLADTDGADRYRDSYGKFCTWRKDFTYLTGYDEEMIGYGFEDFDFYFRLRTLGKREVRFNDPDFLGFISHGDEERVQNEYMGKELTGVYFRYIDIGETEILFLYKNNKVELYTITPYGKDYGLQASIKEKGLKGNWEKKDAELLLYFGDSKKCTLLTNDHGHTYKHIVDQKENIFTRMSDPVFIKNLMKEFPAMINTSKHDQNKRTRNLVVNTQEYGRGIVYKNFELHSTIVS